MASSFREKVGPNSAKFVEFLIKEARNESYMGPRARVFQEIVDKDPFDLLAFVESRADFINRKILETGIDDATHGISEKDSLRLQRLGKAGVFVGAVSREISRKFPVKYLKSKNAQTGN